jgi:hypothetical protein
MRAILSLCMCAAALAVVGCQTSEEVGAGGTSTVEAEPAPRVQVASTSEGSFRGFDLTTAPRTTRAGEPSDLWEERPKGSLSFEIRKDVVCVYSGLDGPLDNITAGYGTTVYHIPDKNCFYIQHDRVLSSTMTFYGPFEGDPNTVLDLGTSSPGGASVAAEGGKPGS